MQKQQPEGSKTRREKTKKNKTRRKKTKGKAKMLSPPFAKQNPA